MFASTPVYFMITNASSTPRGRIEVMSSELRRFRSITSTTMMVIKISCHSAVDRVPMVS